MNDIIVIFFVAFFINLLYELLHSTLYKTALEASLQRYVYLMLKGALFDGFSIAIMYLFTSLVFAKEVQMIGFLIFAVVFAYVWEKYSLSKGKWVYSDNMPIALGVGITPLFQLAVTGILSIYLTLYLN